MIDFLLKIVLRIIDGKIDYDITHKVFCTISSTMRTSSIQMVEKLVPIIFRYLATDLNTKLDIKNYIKQRLSYVW